MVTILNPGLIPVAREAIARGWTRERVIRAIQRGEIRGGLFDGRWFVEVTAGASPAVVDVTAPHDRRTA